MTGAVKKKKTGILLTLILAVFIVTAPARPALALCEIASVTKQSYSRILMEKWKDHIKDFITEIKNFFKDKLWRTAKLEVDARLKELQTTVPKGLTNWWDEHYKPALMAMTRQLHVARIDQARNIGSFIDADNLNEALLTLQNQRADAWRRYRPSETACQVDSVAVTQGKAASLTRGLNASFAKENNVRRGNNTENPATAAGAASAMAADWNEYVQYWCDPAKGDQGCEVAGLMPGRHKDVSSTLWGERQTLDLHNPDNRILRDAVMRYIISPRTLDPIPEQALTLPQGKAELLRRRSRTARINTVYNVLGQLIAARASTGEETLAVREIREKGGVNPDNASASASYQEIQQAMMKDRFHDPEYITKLIDDPELIARENGAINAMKLQQMNDLYGQMEKLVFMEAAIYAAQLDQEIPPPNFTYMRTK